MVGFQENIFYFATSHKISTHVLEILDNGLDKLMDLFYLGHKFGLRTDVAWTMHSFGPCGIVVWGN
jgi:hypothetical protein